MVKDILSLFRKYGKDVNMREVGEGRLKFGEETEVAMSAPIRLKDRKRAFTAASLYYFLKLVKKENKAFNKYMRFCREKKIEYITTLMREPISKYVSGEIDETHADLRKYIEPLKRADVAMDENEGGDDGDHQQIHMGQKNFEDLLTRQISLTDRCTLLGGKAAHSFTWVQEKAHFLTESEKKKRVRTKDKLKEAKQRKLNTVTKPIIVVPAEFSAKLTLFNVGEFLQNGKYMSTKEVRKRGGKRNDRLVISHTFQDGRTLKFRVVDVVSTLTPLEMKSIVAVVASGQPWQFESWQNTGYLNTAHIFKHVKGIHLKYEHEVICDQIKKWKIEVLSLSESSRHLDRSVQENFWKIVETFIKVHRPDVKFS
jgi:hypothetical protein